MLEDMAVSARCQRLCGVEIQWAENGLERHRGLTGGKVS